MKRSFFSLLLSLCIMGVSASELEGDDVIESADEQSGTSLWSHLIPNAAQMQFAGSIGTASVGCGWDYGRQEQWESALIFGVVAKGAYDNMLPTLTIKQSYVPWKITIKRSRYSLTPLTCGAFLNFIFDEVFWLTEPGKYDPPYYKFSTMMRANIFVGQRLNYSIDRGIIKSASLYYELSLSDLHMVSAAINSYLRPRDYLSLALGVKIRFQ